jgi:asparagine synthase (glutamine-hydrolysing)
MPGIVGFVGKTDTLYTGQLLNSMAQELNCDGNNRCDLFTEGEMGLGRVSLGIVNRETQPLWNEDNSRCIVMEGELFDTKHLKQDLIDKGHRFTVDNDAELLLHLYEEYGEAFSLKLNGGFVSAIWDRKEQKLLIVNDRLGLYPLYYTLHNGSLLFASGVRALLADPSLPRDLDPIGIAEFLTFDHLLHDRTLLQEIHLLPQASLLTFSAGRMNIDCYWSPKYPEFYPLRDELDYIEEFQFLSHQAVARQAKDNIPAGILLSGGLDSRLLLGYLANGTVGSNLHSFTWGIPGCDDARFAREVARATGTRHYFYELKSDWLLEKANYAVRETDGMGNIVNLHALATLEEETEHAQILYKGFLGDAMMGFALRQQFWANYDEETAYQAHMQVHSDQGVITFYPHEYPNLFTDAFLARINTAVKDDYIAGMKESESSLLPDQRVFFDFRQRVPRMTIKGVEAARTRAVVRLPFADNDLVDFSLRLPPGLRYERRLMREAFVRTFPKLAQIPIAESGLPMKLCVRDVAARARQVLWWKLQSTGLKDFAGPMRKPYKNYNQWFRTVLRDWVEETLVSQKALQRGFFKPDFIKKVVSEHMDGSNHTVKLGALLSLELWQQQYLD